MTEAHDTGAVTDDPGDLADATCEHCGERFPTERLRDLHRGLEHYRDLDDRERAAYETAYESETDDLRSFRLRALAVLVVLYFGFLMTYAVVTL
jgi:hypothetical protein